MNTLKKIQMCLSQTNRLQDNTFLMLYRASFRTPLVSNTKNNFGLFSFYEKV